MRYVAIFVIFICAAACNKNPVQSTSVEVQKQKQAQKELYTAIVENDLPKARQAVQNGANPNDRMYVSEGEITPLMTAVIYKRETIAEFLITKNASLEAYFDGYTLLDYVYSHYSPKDSIPLFVKQIQARGGK